MTNAELNEKRRRYCKKRLAQGWRQVGWIVPPDVYELVTDYKNTLMEKYKNEQASKT
jgi:hypothetical protein